MEDLTQQLNQILSDPQSMQQIQGLLSSLGGNTAGGGESVSPPPASPSAPGLDMASLTGALSALGLGGQTPSPSPPPSLQNPLGALGGVSPEMLTTVTKLAPLLGQVNQEDDATRLLRALRPLLKPNRQKKVDEAVKILQMMRLLPLLKESGVFSGLLSGLL